MICGAAAHPSFMGTHPNHDRQCRRRSADVGGLHLAIANGGQGKGWVGSEIQTQYAELLSDMYNQTLNAVNEHDADYVPTQLPKQVRSRLIRSLDCWHFEPHKLPEEQVTACTMILFEALYRIEGMEETVGITLQQLCAFLHHLRKIYRYENTYHNYEHALDVLQAIQCYLAAAGMVPPVTILLKPGGTWKSKPNNTSLMGILRLRDLFAIYIAAIGHDVGHPGFTNVFMKNAQTPLSIVFDGQSALEQLHCQLLLRVMRHHGMGSLLDDPIEGVHFRKLLLKTVLATDMGVHGDFMNRFQREVDGNRDGLLARRILISQALLKNADISNPSRPFPVAQHWATALMQEWFSQKSLEDYFALQQTVQPSDNPLGISRSQVFFITTFAKPLLDITVKAVPEMGRYAQHCDMNLARWIERKAQLEATIDVPPPPHATARQPTDFQTVFPLTLPGGSSCFTTPATTMAPSIASGSSDSTPTSPSDGTSAMFSPLTDLSHQGYAHSNQHKRTPSSESTSSHGSASAGRSGASTMGMTNGMGANLHGLLQQHQDTEAIRAAGKMGLRQQRNPNRNSWCGPLSFRSPSYSSVGPSPLSGVGLASTIGAEISPLCPVPPPATAPSKLSATCTVSVPQPVLWRSGLPGIADGDTALNGVPPLQSS